MYKCAICKKEVERSKIKKMTAGTTGQSSDRRGGDTLIVLDVCEECYGKKYPKEHKDK